MLPHNHFLFTGVVIFPLTVLIFPGKPLPEIVKWVLAGSIVSMTIDLDIYCLVVLKSGKQEQLRVFKNPIEIHRKFTLFMDTITETGVLRSGLITHVIFSLLLILLFYSFFSLYFIPILLGVISHLISDIPNLNRIRAQKEVSK